MSDAVVNRGPGGQWLPGTSGNPKGAQSSVKSRNTMRAAIEAEAPAIIEKLRELALAGDVTAARTLLERVLPTARTDSEPVVIEGLKEAQTLGDKARCIIAAVAVGDLSPDVAERLLIALGACAKILEVDELEKRISALEGTDYA